MTRRVQNVEFSSDTVGRDRDFICPACGTQVHARHTKTTIGVEGTVHTYTAKHSDATACDVTEFKWKQRGV